MTCHGTGRFAPEEVAYLTSLPVVRGADAERIRYTREFKIDALRRYFSGEAPSAIFRSVGLDPSLIGGKRIERCIARWKGTPELVDEARRRPDGAAPTPFDGPPASLDELYEAARRSLSLSKSKRFDLRDLIIYQQALHIGELEAQIGWLRGRLGDDAVPPLQPSPSPSTSTTRAR